MAALDRMEEFKQTFEPRGFKHWKAWLRKQVTPKVSLMLYMSGLASDIAIHVTWKSGMIQRTLFTHYTMSLPEAIRITEALEGLILINELSLLNSVIERKNHG